MDKSRWNSVVDRSTCGTVFHRYEWIEAIESGLSYPATHLVVEKDTNPIGVFPNFVVDVPMTPFSRLTSLYPGFGGPLLTTDVKASLSAMLETIPELCGRRTISHEIRACNTNYLRYYDHAQSHGYRPAQMGGRFILRLDKGYDALLADMKSARRNGIERGRKEEYEIVEEEITTANLRRFHRVYERHMATVGGDPYPRTFFEALSGMDSRLLLVTIHIEGEYAGGFLGLLDEQQSAVHGFFVSVLEEYFENHASELLYDYVIRWAIEHDYENYDFGGSGADFEDGAFKFKEQFGGQLIPNLYWERGTSPLWKVARAGRSLYWQHQK